MQNFSRLEPRSVPVCNYIALPSICLQLMTPKIQLDSKLGPDKGLLENYLRWGLIIVFVHVENGLQHAMQFVIPRFVFFTEMSWDLRFYWLVTYLQQRAPVMQAVEANTSARQRVKFM